MASHVSEQAHAVTFPPPCGEAGPSVHREEISWAPIASFLTLLLLTCACYWPALNGEFQWDDGVLVRDNELLRSFAGLLDIWASTKAFDYFPLTYTTFWLEWRLWGTDPAGYHLVNLALHLVGACLLWRLLLDMRLPGAWFGALLFAIHPVNVASVAWIAERKNTVSMVFYLACLLNYWRCQQTPDSIPKRRFYAWALGFFVLAALSKSSVVMLPFVLLLLVWWRCGKIGWHDVVRSVPFFLISLACGVTTLWFQYHRAMDPESHLDGKLPLLESILLSGHNAWFYLGKALYPVRLGMLYPRWTPDATIWTGYLPLLGWAAVLAAAWAGCARWGRGSLLVLTYFLVTLLPVAGLLHMSFFTYSYVSDHLIHLSLVGIIVGVAAVLGAWHARGGTSAWLAAAVMTVIAGWCGVATLQRADQFSSARKLWESTRGVAPDSFAVYNSLGADAQLHGRIREAESYYREALRLEPRSFLASHSLANMLRAQGKWQESAALYQAILQLEPDAGCHNNLGVVFLEMGDTRQARVQFQRALALDPAMGKACHNLYRTEKAEGHLTAAAAALLDCLRIDQSDATAMTALASLNLEIISANPGITKPDVSAFTTTIQLAERACRLTRYRNAQALAVLSRALFASGRRDEAIAVGNEAIAMALETHQTAFAEDFGRFAASMSEPR